MHATIALLNTTFLMVINDNSYNSFSCLQLCNTWRSYIQGYIWTLDIGGHSELGVENGDYYDTSCGSYYYDRIYC